MQFIQMQVLLIIWFGTGLCSSEDEYGLIMSFVSGNGRGWDTHIVTEIGNPQSTETNHRTTQTLQSRNVSSIAYDFLRQKLYLLDLSSRAIMQFDNFNIIFNMTSGLTTFHEGISSVTANLAVDWISGNVYWTDSDFGWIAVRQEADISPSHYKILIRKDIQRPEAIAVDPLTGYIFWSDTGTQPKLERADLDGSNRYILIYSGLVRPTSITLDYSNKRIYWVDSEKQTVEAVDYNGANRKVLAKQYNTRFTSITAYADWLYAFDARFNATIVINKETGAISRTAVPSKLTPKSIVMYSNDSQPKGQDHCGEKACSQLCLGISSGVKCLCWDGFVLTQDQTTCRSDTTSTNRSIALSNGTHICLADIRYFIANQNSLRIPTCLHGIQQGITYIAADMGRAEIYFHSSTERTLSRLRLTDQLTEPLLTEVGPVGGIAVDWIGQKLYWTQPEDGEIYYVSLKPNERQSVRVLSELQSPMSIAINPLDKEIFWTSEDGKIEMASMNGEDKRTKFEGEQPVSLQFHVSSNRLFWIDKRKLRSIGRNGEGTSSLPLSTDVTKLAIYKNFATWLGTNTEQDYSTLYFAKPFEAQLIDGSLAVYNTAQFQISGPLTSFFIMDPDLQPTERGPCEVNNGDCGEFCLPDGAGRTCHCRSGFHLEDNRRICSAAESFRNNFLIATVKGVSEIYQVSLETDELVTINIPEIKSPSSPVYIKESHEIVWVENGRRQIHKTNLQTWHTTVGWLGHSAVQRLCIDHSTRNLYYVTQASTYRPIQSSISVVTFDGSVSKILVDQRGEFHGIAVYPSKGLMFWTASGVTPYISRASMDGNGQVIIVEKDIISPLGIALDFKYDRLYWCDHSTDKIEYVDLDGSNRQVLYHDVDGSLQRIALSGDYLYYTAANRPSATSINLRNPGEMKNVITDPNLGILGDIFVYDGTTDNINSLCSVRNGNCSSLCLPTPEGRTCSCRDNVNLLDDGRTCSDVIRCPRDILQGSLLPSCLRYRNESCGYVCGEDYTQRDSELLLMCMEDGTWNVSPLDLCKQLSSDIGDYIGVIVGSVVSLIILIIAAMLYLKWYRLKRVAGNLGHAPASNTNANSSSGVFYSDGFCIDMLCCCCKKNVELIGQYPTLPSAYSTGLDQNNDDYLEPNVTRYHLDDSAISFWNESESVYPSSSTKDNRSRTASTSSSVIQLYGSRRPTSLTAHGCYGSARSQDVLAHSCYGMRPMTQPDESRINNEQSTASINDKNEDSEHIYASLSDEEEDVIEFLHNKVGNSCPIPHRTEGDSSSFVSDDSTFSVYTDSELDENEATEKHIEAVALPPGTNDEQDCRSAEKDANLRKSVEQNVGHPVRNSEQYVDHPDGPHELAEQCDVHPVRFREWLEDNYDNADTMLELVVLNEDHLAEHSEEITLQTEFEENGQLKTVIDGQSLSTVSHDIPEHINNNEGGECEILVTEETRPLENMNIPLTALEESGAIFRPSVCPDLRAPFLPPNNENKLVLEFPSRDIYLDDGSSVEIDV